MSPTTQVEAGQLSKLIEEVHVALVRAPAAAAEPEQKELVPAVAIRKSVTPDYIVSLEDGRKFKSLKRHLAGTYGMTPGRVPREVGPAARLSDGRAELCQGALGPGQAHGPGPQGRRRAGEEGARTQARREVTSTLKRKNAPPVRGVLLSEPS